MDINELNEKIEKKKLDIEKRKKLTEKIEKKVETLTDEFDKRWELENIRTSNNKLRDLNEQLENLYKQLEKAKAKDAVERIPVIEEFLEQWKVKAINWYKESYESFVKYMKERADKQKLLTQWEKENKLFSYDKETRKKIEEKEKELGIDDETHKLTICMRYNGFIVMLHSSYRWNENERNTKIEKEVEREKNEKRVLFISRVKDITGTITDASALRIGMNGEINGIVIGEKGKAKVETISAGGYNIQCWHFRVLVHELKK